MTYVVAAVLEPPQQQPQPPPQPPSALRCVECDDVSRDIAHGWRAYIVGGFAEEPAEVAVYCPVCAERELGEDERRGAHRPRRHWGFDPLTTS